MSVKSAMHTLSFNLWMFILKGSLGFWLLKQVDSLSWTRFSSRRKINRIMSYGPRFQPTYVDEGINSRCYPLSAALKQPLQFLPADSGSRCNFHESEPQSMRQKPIQKQLQCHAHCKVPKPETFHLSHSSWPTVHNSRFFPQALTGDLNHCSSQVTPEPVNLKLNAQERRHRLGAWDQAMASTYQDLPLDQYHMDFFRPAASTSEWNTFHCDKNCFNSGDNVEDATSNQPVGWPYYSKTPFGSAPRHDSYRYPTDTSRNNFNDAANDFQLTGDLEPTPLIQAPTCYHDLQADVFTSPAKYQELSTEESWSPYETISSTAELEWLDCAADQANNYTDFTSTTSIETSIIPDCVNYAQRPPSPQSLAANMPYESHASVDSKPENAGSKNTIWDSFLNADTYQALLNHDEPHHVNTADGQDLELLAGIYDPPLPTLEADGELDQDLQQAQPIESITEPQREGQSLFYNNANRKRQGRRDISVDRKLIEWKQQGLSYKEIKERGGFEEAESTLRGRYRTLTKKRQDRLRKPVWPDKAVDALLEAVEHFTRPASRHATNRIPWKRVAEWMAAERGCYRYGNATVKKKYQELQNAT